MSFAASNEKDIKLKMPKKIENTMFAPCVYEHEETRENDERQRR